MTDPLSIRHKIPVAAKHLQRESELALKKAIPRALAELIKNSVDSINRGTKRGEVVSPKVRIAYKSMLGKIEFEISDEAEGMDLEMLDKATRHGEQVSGLHEVERV